MELADSGVGSATVVEASPAYFDVTRSEVESRYGSRPTQFVVGDFAAIASTLADADVVTLDRVVCCYPDAEDLLRAAAQRARRLVALTYPRNRWYVRAFVKLENFWQRLRRSSFRAFVHSPERMHAVLEAAGLVRGARHGTAVWMFDLYHREMARVPPQS
jgi:magnesium-protoporphyrin O-methyltransferase